MEINSIENESTRWLQIIITLNYIEILILFLFGLINIANSSSFGVILLIIAGIQAYYTKELANFTMTGKDGNIILYLIFGFSVPFPLSILYALQLYGLAFNEPTKEFLKQAIENNKTQKITKLKI